MHHILLRPLITEQSMHEATRGWFGFVVSAGSDKLAIKQAIESQFQVHVEAVRTIISKGKTVRVGKRRTEQARHPIKKAYARLKKGETIGLFGVEAQSEKK